MGIGLANDAILANELPTALVSAYDALTDVLSVHELTELGMPQPRQGQE